MNEPREAFAGGLGVIKEAGQPGLATALHHHDSQYEISQGFLLMPMCVGQNETDILAFYQMCPSLNREKQCR